MAAVIEDDQREKRRMPLRQRAALWVLRKWGWRIEGGAPQAERYVLVLYPHTSKKDAPLWALMRYALDIPASILMKKSAFIPPFSILFRKLGAIPVSRKGNQNQTEWLTNQLRSGKIRVLALSPEGTRSKVNEWHTGFYHIATEAGVPIALGYSDFGTKTCGIGPVLYPSGDIEADMPRIRRFYAGVRGDIPEQQAPVRASE